METTATVFGISAEDARKIGKYTSWAWLIVTYPFFDVYTYAVIVANFLHFNPNVLDMIGSQMGHKFTVDDIHMLGMIGYEYFLQTAMFGFLVLLVSGGALESWFIVAMLILPWLAL